MGNLVLLTQFCNEMKSTTIRWIVLTSSVVIAAIVVIQLFWLNKIYSFEQKNFKVNTVKSIRGLYEDVALSFNPTFNLQKLIEQPADNYFLSKIDTIASIDSIAYYLKQELEDFDVLTDVYLAIYEFDEPTFKEVRYLPSVASAQLKEGTSKPTVYKRPYHYLLLYFPHRKEYVLSQMTFWFVSGGALIIVLVALAISLFYFYREKTLSETQKDFVNNFTHEFRTPLAVMKIAAGVLNNEDIVQNPARLKNYAGIVQNQTEHLQKQVDKLLKSARSENGELPLDKKNTDIHEMVLQAIRKIKPLADEKSASITTDSLSQGLFANVDESHLELAIINLIENGLKYSAHPIISIALRKEPQTIIVSIKDNGIGIEKKYQRKIFRKFYRVPTGDVHNVKGVGLGLDFVKRVVDAHHGKITVKSRPGHGTEFQIELPIK